MIHHKNLRYDSFYEIFFVIIQLFFKVPILFNNLQHTKYCKNTLIKSNGLSCKISKTGQCMSGRGKVIGGSGSLNAMLFVRGNRAVYDNWLAESNKGWGYDDVWPYFEELVHAVGIQRAI